MANSLSTKWWLILLQGILLIALSIYIFDNPVTVLASISFWFGIMVLAAGAIGIIVWLASSKEERQDMSLIWAILTFAFGLVLLFNLLATMKTLTVIFGLWCLLSGVFLVSTGWVLTKINYTGWVMVIAGILCVFAAVMMMMHIASGAIAISTLLGLQVLFTGIALVLLAFAKRMVQHNANIGIAAAG
jgi:membrane protein HdeD